MKSDSSVKKLNGSPGEVSQEKKHVEMSNSTKKNCSSGRSKMAQFSPYKKKSVGNSNYLMTCPSYSTEEIVQKAKSKSIKATKISKSK
jgi:hypothetical protein